MSDDFRPRRSQRLDGNAILGSLSVFGDRDVSELLVECGSCHARTPLACWVVEADDTAYIVRCRECTRTAWTILRDGDRVTVRVPGPVTVIAG